MFCEVVRLQSSRGMLKYSFVECCDWSDNGLLDMMNGIGSRQVEHSSRCCTPDVALNQNLVQWLPRGAGAWCCSCYVDICGANTQPPPFSVSILSSSACLMLTRCIYPRIRTSVTQRCGNWFNFPPYQFVHEMCVRLYELLSRVHAAVNC